MAQGEGYPLAGQHWTLDVHDQIGAYGLNATIELVFEENGCISMSSSSLEPPLEFDTCSSQFAVTGLDGAQTSQADLSFSYDFPYPKWRDEVMGGVERMEDARASGNMTCPGMEIPEVGEEITGCAMPDVTADRVTLTRTQ